MSRKSDEFKKYMFKKSTIVFFIIFIILSLVFIVELMVFIFCNEIPAVISWSSFAFSLIGIGGSFFLGTFSLYAGDKFIEDAEGIIYRLTIGKDLDATKEEIELLLVNKFGVWYDESYGIESLKINEIYRIIYSELNRNPFIENELFIKFIEKINKPNNSILIAELNHLLRSGSDLRIDSIITIINRVSKSLLEINFFKKTNLSINEFLIFCQNVPLESKDKIVDSILNDFEPNVNPYHIDSENIYLKNISLLEQFLDSHYLNFDMPNHIDEINEDIFINVGEHLNLKMNSNLNWNIENNYDDVLIKNIWTFWYYESNNKNFSEITGIEGIKDILSIIQMFKYRSFNEKEENILKVISNAISCFIRDGELFKFERSWSSPSGIELLKNKKYIEYNISLIEIRKIFISKIYLALQNSLNELKSEYKEKYNLINILHNLLRELFYENNLRYFKIENHFESYEKWKNRYIDNLIYEYVNSRLTIWNEEIYNESIREGKNFILIDEKFNLKNIEEESWWNELNKFILSKSDYMFENKIEINNKNKYGTINTYGISGYENRDDFNNDLNNLISNLDNCKKEFFNLIKDESFLKLKEHMKNK